jgi:Fe-S cluster biosynthesis and repair protein YggX
MELERAKFKTRQGEKSPSSLSMNAMAETIKMMQTLVVNEKETNMQLSLELKKVQK